MVRTLLCDINNLYDPVSSCIGRAGVPMEVMGLMLGEFVDDYTVRVIDVFAMPQSGTVRVVLKALWTLTPLSLLPSPLSHHTRG